MTETIYVDSLPSAVSITINVKERFTTNNVSGVTVTILETGRTPSVNGDTYSNTEGTTNGSGNVTLSVRPGSYGMVVDGASLYGPTTATIDVYTGGEYVISDVAYFS